MKRIVIVGAGFAGLAAARGLKKARARITVIDRYNHHLFQPLLYQVATAGLSAADIASPIRHILRKQKNLNVLMDEVISIDPIARTVSLREGFLTYDTLILAPGSQYNYFGNERWERTAPCLKTIDGALEIRERILLAFENAEKEIDKKERERLLTFVLVGGGPTGVEMAGAIAELALHTLKRDFRIINPKSARIVLVEKSPRILPTFAPDLSAKAEAALKRFGVEVRTNISVTNIDDKSVSLGSDRLHSNVVIWTAGVKANPVGKWLDLPNDPMGRVSVTAKLHLLSDPNIFVIGDAARCEIDGKPLPGLAPVALQQGSYVAKLLMGRESTPGKVLPPFQYRDRGALATVGRSFAVAEFRYLSFSGCFGWFVWLVVHILQLIGFRNRIIVLIQWIWGYFTYQRGTRIISRSAAAS